MITDDNWVCRCADLAEKQRLLDHALAQGVPVAHPEASRHDAYLDLGAYDGRLLSYPHNPAEEDEGFQSMTPSDFLRACDRFARSRAHGNGCPVYRGAGKF